MPLRLRDIRHGRGFIIAALRTFKEKHMLVLAGLGIDGKVVQLQVTFAFTTDSGKNKTAAHIPLRVVDRIRVAKKG